MKRPWWRPPAEVLGINRRNLDHVFRDPRPGRFRDLDDKQRTKNRLEERGIAVPPTLALVEGHGEMDRLDEVLDSVPTFVIKPTRGWGGRGILVLERDGDGWRTPGGRRLGRDEIHSHAGTILAGGFSLDESDDTVLVEERIFPHPALLAMYPRGLSDLRIVLEAGEPLQAMLRVPTDASDGRANLHEGGLGLGIDLETGRVVHAVCGERPVETHPDTKSSLIGFEVPDWARCLELARGVASAFADIEYLGVDLVHDRTRGPLVLEANARPGLAIQIANRTAQPVRRRTPRSPFDRFTERTAWLVLLLLALSPLAYTALQYRSDPDVRTVRRVGWSDEERIEVAPAAGMEWSGAGTPLSETDDRFASARFAAEAGDTALALRLYRESAADTALAPFALNNIALIQRSRGQLVPARDTLEEALRLFPRYARGAYNLGLVERDLGREDAAIERFRLALEIRPSHAGSWSELGESLAGAGRLEEAVDALERAIRFDPDRISDRRRLGRWLLRLGRPGEAAERYREALALDPDSDAARTGYVRARLVQSAVDSQSIPDAEREALSDLLEPILKGKRVSASDRMLGAEVAAWGGDRLGALEVLRGVEEKGLPSRGRILVALLDLELGRFEEVAAGDAETGTSRLASAARLGHFLDRRDAASVPFAAEGLEPVLVPLALLVNGDSVAEREWEEARADAVDASERIWVDALRGEADSLPDDITEARWLALDENAVRPPLATSFLVWTLAKVRPDLAATLLPRLDHDHAQYVPRLRDRFEESLREEDFDHARDLGRQLLRAMPGDAAVILGMARSERERGRAKQARALLERLSAADRAHPGALRLRAGLLIDDGKHGAARRLLRDLRQLEPGSIETLDLLAEAQAGDRRRRSACETLAAALSLDPGRTDLRERLARLLMGRRKYEEATAEWRRILALATEDRLRRSALFNLALCHQRREDPEAALAIWDDLIAEDPGSVPAVYNRALALERLGRTEEAVRGYRDALALDAAHTSSRERLARLVPGGPR